MSKNPVLNTYNFVTSWNRQRPLDSSQYQLIIRQQPKQARLCNSKERDRRPVDPPPIIQLKVTGTSEEAQNFLQSPYYFMCANLVHPTNNDDAHFTISSRLLAGTVVSSLHKLKDIDNTDGGFFVFGDISVRVEGRYRLRFSLFEIIRDEVVHIQSAVSDVFNVYSPKTFPGMSESTFLSRSFSDQGVRIRIRKEHRIQMKRPQAKIAEVNEGDDPDGAQQKKKRRQTFPPIDTSSASQPSDLIGSHHMMSASPISGTFSIPTMRHPDVNDHSSPSRPYLRPQSHSLDYPNRPPCEFEPEQLPSAYGHRSSLGTSSLPLRPTELDEPPRPQFASEIHNEPLPYDNSPYALQQSEQPPLTSMPAKSSTLPLQPSQPHLPARSATMPLPPQPSRHTKSATLPPPSLLSGGDYHQASPFRLVESTVPRRGAQFPQLSPSAVTTSPQTTAMQPASQYVQSDSYYNAPVPHRPIPMKSRTLPTYNRPSRVSPPMNGTQLPTPRTSIDGFNSHPHLSPFPPTPPLLSSTESVSSSSSGSTATGNAMDPRYTSHLTSSPRPVHHNLPESPLLLGGKAVSRTSSLPVTSRAGAISSPSSMASTNMHSSGAGSISLPPISSLMQPLLKKESPGANVPSANSVAGNRYYQPESLQHHHRQAQYPNGCGNGTGVILSHGRHHYANPMGQSTMDNTI